MSRLRLALLVPGTNRDWVTCIRMASPLPFVSLLNPLTAEQPWQQNWVLWYI